MLNAYTTPIVDGGPAAESLALDDLSIPLPLNKARGPLFVGEPFHWNEGADAALESLFTANRADDIAEKISLLCKLTGSLTEQSSSLIPAEIHLVALEYDYLVEKKLIDPYVL